MPRSERYIWDPFCLPGHYAHLRTPLPRAISKPLAELFCSELLTLASSQFGCMGLTPPWLSLYLTGHHQRPHRDTPHGPLAYVYSLNPSGRSFRGGETVLKLSGNREESIRLRCGELLIFDASLLHRVETVQGTLDPMKGRLVIHGWFSDPQPLAWTNTRVLKTDFSSLYESHALPADKSIRGFLLLRLNHQRREFEVHCSTLKGRPSAQVALQILSMANSFARQQKWKPNVNVVLPFWWPGIQPL